MGVYITGNFKPPKANYKLVQLWYDGYAHFLTEDGMVTGTWTLVPDHGDLVDRDELMMKMWEASAYAPNHCSWVNARVVFAKDIEDAPVVIPAERSEDGEA